MTNNENLNEKIYNSNPIMSEIEQLENRQEALERKFSLAKFLSFRGKTIIQKIILGIIWLLIFEVCATLLFSVFGGETENGLPQVPALILSVVIIAPAVAIYLASGKKLKKRNELCSDIELKITQLRESPELDWIPRNYRHPIPYYFIADCIINERKTLDEAIWKYDEYVKTLLSRAY